MEMIETTYNEKEKFAATIGFFDGVHTGHQYVIEQLKNIAKVRKQKSLVITFANHPRKVLQSDYQPELLNTLPEKLSHLEKLGIDACTILDFTLDMAKLSAFDFMKNELKNKYGVATLLIGYDHRFGHNREKSFLDYVQYGKNLGIDVCHIDRYNSDMNISSSQIRSALLEGNIQEANKMLGYSYSLEGKVIDGFKVGRKIGFPTANLRVLTGEKIIPRTGVYVVSVFVDYQLYYGMLNIGMRPTLKNGENISIEVHIIDFDKDIYNKNIKIEFLEKIRDEKKFNNIDELVSQLNKDHNYVKNNYSFKK